MYYSDQTYDPLYDKQATSSTCRRGKDLTDQMQQISTTTAAYIVMWYQDKLQAYRTDTWTGWTETPGGVVFNFTRDNYLNAIPALIVREG